MQSKQYRVTRLNTIILKKNYNKRNQIRKVFGGIILPDITFLLNVFDQWFNGYFTTEIKMVIL